MEKVMQTDPYDGIEMPKPPKGYRLAEWGESSTTSQWWCDTQSRWLEFGCLWDEWYTNPKQSIFAIPKPRVSIPLVPVTDKEDQ